jgi:hypothetical protein
VNLLRKVKLTSVLMGFIWTFFGGLNLLMAYVLAMILFT